MNTSQIRQLQTDMQAVVNDAEALIKETAGDTGAAVAGVRDRLVESLATARARALRMEEAVAAQAHAAARSTDRYVHENPWQTVGIAAAAGILLGVLIGRR